MKGGLDPQVGLDSVCSVHMFTLSLDCIILLGPAGCHAHLPAMKKAYF